MINDTLFMIQSLIDNLFYLRTMREFCLNIQLSFLENNKYYIDIANDFGVRCEELGERVIKLANKNLPESILNSNSFVTDYTLNCELVTEKLFNVDINTNLTIAEMNIEAGSKFNYTEEELAEITDINENAIALSKNFIDFCKEILDLLKENKLFSYTYPTFFTFIIKEMDFYYNDLLRLSAKNNADPTFIVNYEYWYCDSMKTISQLIIGLCDPSLTTILTNSDNFRKIFMKQMTLYKEMNITPDSQLKLNQSTIQYVEDFIKFLRVIINGILNNKYYFIVDPIFFDNMLTEAYYFLYLLKGARYGIQPK